METGNEQESFGLPPDLEKANEILRGCIKGLLEENKRLRSFDNDRLRELARLQNENLNLRRQIEIIKERPKGKRGRPSTPRGYQSALLMEAIEVLHEHWRGDIAEKEAAIIADKRLRERAAEMQAAGTPCEFAYLSSTYQPSEDEIYRAFLKEKSACKAERPLQNAIPISAVLRAKKAKPGRKPKK